MATFLKKRLQLHPGFDFKGASAAVMAVADDC
jgi:hypothetical protein